MLYEEMTCGAIVTGFEIKFEGYTGEDAEALEATLATLNQKHGVKVQLYVPGDSATDHSMDPTMELYAYEAFLGMASTVVETYDAPAVVHASTFAKDKATIAAIPEAYWADLCESSEIDKSSFQADKLKTALMSFGPLCYASLSVGRIHPSSDSDNTVYSFHSVQDMNQEWLENGVDGASIANVEFTDIVEVDFSDEAIAGYLAKASEFDAPKLFMTVRYD